MCIGARGCPLEPSSQPPPSPPTPFSPPTPPTSFPPLPSPTLRFPPPPTSLPPPVASAAASLQPAGTRPAGTRPVHARSDRIGSARIGSVLLGSFDLNRHGGRHISTWLSAGMGTDRRAPLHLFFSAQLALGSAQLGSARLGSAGAAWLARLVRHSAQDSEAPASRLGGAPRRRLLRAQHRQSAAQPRISKIWAARWVGAALSLGDERCGAGEGGLPH